MIRTRRNPLARMIVAVLAVFTVLGLVAGCSSDNGAGTGDRGSGKTADRGPLPAAKPFLDKAIAAVKGLHDVQLDLYVDGQIPQLPVHSVNAYLTNQPAVAGQGDADVTVNGSQIQAKFVVVDGDLWAQLSAGSKYRNMGKASDIYDASAILDPNRGIAHLLETITGAKVEGREAIAGIDTVRMSGTVPAESLTSLVPGYKSGPRPVTFWIQEDAPNNLVRAHVEFDQGTLAVNLSNWGEKVTLIDPKTGS